MTHFSIAIEMDQDNCYVSLHLALSQSTFDWGSTMGLLDWLCNQPSSTNMPPYHIVGTPPYASLNMHNGMCESLYLYSRPASYLKGM